METQTGKAVAESEGELEDAVGFSDELGLHAGYPPHGCAQLVAAQCFVGPC